MGATISRSINTVIRRDRLIYYEIPVYLFYKNSGLEYSIRKRIAVSRRGLFEYGKTSIVPDE